MPCIVFFPLLSLIRCSEHPKQAAHGWGGEDGNAELADEQAGAAIAKEDEKEAVTDAAEATGEAAPEPEPEPEDKTVSYAAYLAEQAEKKLSLAASNIRKPNEGSKQKDFQGQKIERNEEEDAYIAGSGGKAKRERQRKEKTLVELDGDRMREAPRDDGGRGRGRGRGGRGEGGFRGEGRGRGGGRGRGDRGGGDRGDGGYRGGRGGRGGQSGPTPNVSDTSAFPTLGS